MIYPDTNIIASLLLNETRADSVVATLKKLDRKICLSNWTLHELYCVFAKSLRMKIITQQVFDHLFGETLALIEVLNFGAPVIKLEAFHLENISVIILQKPQLDIRAADSVHLGILSANPALTFLTADKRLYNSAAALNIDTILLP
jgi:predicted nucleic acid-binding protein